MKSSATILLLLSITQSLFSQAYFRPGYVVLNNGDTVKGMIKDMEWSISPGEIEFQTSTESNIQKYTPLEITSFFTSRPAYYESHKILYDADNQITKYLPQSREPGWRDADIFMQVIVKGGISLYRFDDANGRIHFFLRNQTEQPVELLNRSYIVNDNSIILVRTFEGWKQQLLNLSTDCSSLFASINSAKYLERLLKKIVENINTCRGENMIMLASPQHVKPSQFGVLVQGFFNYSQINYATTTFSAVNFALGASYEVFSKNKPERLSYYNELKYKRVAQEGYTYFDIPVDFSFQSVRLINALRFSYPGKKNSSFWNIGTNLGYRISNSVKFKTGEPVPGNYNSGFELGLMLGAGSIIINQPKIKVSLELRYELEQAPFKKTDFVGSHALGIVTGVKF